MKVLMVSDLLVILRVSRKVGKRVYFGVKRIALQLGTDSVLSIGYNDGTSRVNRNREIPGDFPDLS